MDFSKDIKKMFPEAVELPDPLPEQEQNTEQEQPINATEEEDFALDISHVPEQEILSMIYLFDNGAPLIAFFLGETSQVVISEKPRKFWMFIDLNKKNWLLPQWSAISILKEDKEPGKLIYQIKYFGVDEKDKETHKATIFSKVAPTI